MHVPCLLSIEKSINSINSPTLCPWVKFSYTVTTELVTILTLKCKDLRACTKTKLFRSRWRGKMDVFSFATFRISKESSQHSVVDIACCLSSNSVTSYIARKTNWPKLAATESQQGNCISDKMKNTVLPKMLLNCRAVIVFRKYFGWSVLESHLYTTSWDGASSIFMFPNMVSYHTKRYTQK